MSRATDKLLVNLLKRLAGSSDEKRIVGQNYDDSDIEKKKDIAYMPDGVKEHLLDIYYTKDHNADTPTVIDIHGGGLVRGYKELNRNSNYEMTRRGFNVVSLSYRLIPQTTTLHQIEDVLKAVCFIEEHREKYGLNTDNIFLMGDSAGGFLAYFLASLTGSRELKQIFGLKTPTVQFKALGLISPMLHTKRNDMAKIISSLVTDKSEESHAAYPYLIAPERLFEKNKLPPTVIITSEEDMLLEESEMYKKLFDKAGFTNEYIYYPKGTTYKLDHVFAVSYPMYKESQEVLDKIAELFRSQM